MKKPTVDSLQKQLAEMTRKHDEEHRCRVLAVDRMNKAEDACRVAETAFRQQTQQHEQESRRQNMAREDAQASFVDFKGTVLEYFMLTANPETAKDTERLKAIQLTIATARPDFRISRTDRPSGW